MIVAELLTRAKKLNQWEKYAAAGTTYWTSTTVYRADVPAGKRWFLLGGNIYRSQNATLTVRVYDASANQIMSLNSEAAGTGTTAYPNTSASGLNLMIKNPIVLDETEYITIAFGAAQDTNAWCSCVVLEVDM